MSSHKTVGKKALRFAKLLLYERSQSIVVTLPVSILFKAESLNTTKIQKSKFPSTISRIHSFLGSFNVYHVFTLRIKTFANALNQQLSKRMPS